MKTDISIAIPEFTYARVGELYYYHTISSVFIVSLLAPRSGLALKHSIDVGAGVIDYDYRGPVGVILFNYSDVDFPILRGDRIAQLIIERISMPEIVEVGELSETVRGAGGFGSSGVSTVVPSPDGATESEAKKQRNE